MKVDRDYWSPFGSLVVSRKKTISFRAAIIYVIWRDGPKRASPPLGRCCLHSCLASPRLSEGKTPEAYWSRRSTSLLRWHMPIAAHRLGRTTAL